MSKVVIHAQDLTKVYKIYAKPSDRFKETFSHHKEKYYKVPFTTCNDCKYYEYKNGMIIVR